MIMEYLDLVLSVMTHPLYVMAAIGCFVHSMGMPAKDLNIIVKVIVCLIISMSWPIGVTALTLSYLREG